MAAPPSAEQVTKFQIHLVNTLDLPAKEKIWLVDRLGICDTQKSIAAALNSSASYVSSSLREAPDALSEDLASLCERLSSVGQSPAEAAEPQATLPTGTGGKETT